jgi:AGCS family alanine or glycine:cation symporter
MPQAIRISLERGAEGEGDVSQFGALTTALAATIGTGNIVGVATAVASGGPGAVLWMWLTGVFGIATKYAEALLVGEVSRDRRRRHDGGRADVRARARPAQRWLGMLFAALTAVSAFGIGNTVQANSIATLVRDTFGISPWISGGIMTALTALVILGGIQSIAAVCEKLVPFMAIFYVGGCLIILALNATEIPATISLIVTSAFTGQAAVGGFLGAGCARGDALRRRARPLRTSRARQRADRRRRGPDEEPRTPGARVVHGHVLGHGRRMSDDGARRRAVRRMDAGSGRCRAHLEGLQRSAVHRPDRADGSASSPSCSRRSSGWAYYGEKACEYLFGHRSIAVYRVALGDRRHGRIGGAASGRVVGRRHHERAHGDSEPDLALAAHARDRRRNAPAPLERGGAER